MINLMSFYYNDSFYYKRKDRLCSIEESLKFHIDHLIDNQWQQEQVIIKTNFPFEYNGIKNTFFTIGANLIPKNLFLTKFISIYETLLQYPNEIIWFHDIDTFQIKPFNINSIKQLINNIDILYSNYWPGNPRPQGASVFYNTMTQSIEDIYNLIINNLNLDYDDEQILQKFSLAKPDIIKATLPYEYNTSITKTSFNKRISTSPYCLHGNIYQSRFSRRLYNKIVSQPL